ncbi:MAG: transcriptional repressor [Gammaproteobacteria bacterium]|nr:transcriptional repressor [Betaproteobacteria bacterium]MBM4224829.1 transcriptional repressor [Gammaproteobacteria bacterium]
MRKSLATPSVTSDTCASPAILAPGGGIMRGRVSRNQDLVLGVLRAAAGQALTAYEVLARLEAVRVRGPQTVYRALDALRQAGLVHRIESINAFTVCVHADGSGAHGAKRHGPGPHHVHLHRPAFAVCRDCGAIQELDDAPLAAALSVVADRTGYRVRERVIELVGACPTCAKTLQEPAVD